MVTKVLRSTGFKTANLSAARNGVLDSGPLLPGRSDVTCFDFEVSGFSFPERGA
jgi:hypothetical protein